MRSTSPNSGSLELGGRGCCTPEPFAREVGPEGVFCILHRCKILSEHQPKLKGGNMSKKTFLFSAIIIALILLAACQPSTDAPKATPTLQVTPSNTSVPTITATPAGALPNILPLQKLRIINQSVIELHNLVVVFPDERIAFGDVPGGTTTEYREVPQGVYRYAAYDVEVNGQSYEQPVIDWVGETPKQGDAFTYILDVDPARWQTEGQVIQLVEVSID